MWITFVWVIFWELLDYLGSVQRAWLVGRRASTGMSGHSLWVSHLWILGDASKTQVFSDQEAAAPPVCFCMHYCFIFLELKIISFDKQKGEHVLGSCHLQFLSYSDGSCWAWLSWMTLYFCLPFKKNIEHPLCAQDCMLSVVICVLY